ncbi:MAG: hypothetical protein ACRCZ4_09600, partial [Plesiomonas sp.]|uniref:hypothetical protein n=1 Tax=Plesiomonas sp. TaxID=2486279 RepID=UPI003F2CC232
KGKLKISKTCACPHLCGTFAGVMFRYLPHFMLLLLAAEVLRAVRLPKNAAYFELSLMQNGAFAV